MTPELIFIGLCIFVMGILIGMIISKIILEDTI